jgi:hypothetical protein
MFDLLHAAAHFLAAAAPVSHGRAYADSQCGANCRISGCAAEVALDLARTTSHGFSEQGLSRFRVARVEELLAGQERALNRQ